MNSRKSIYRIFLTSIVFVFITGCSNNSPKELVHKKLSLETPDNKNTLYYNILKVNDPIEFRIQDINPDLSKGLAISQEEDFFYFDSTTFNWVKTSQEAEIANYKINDLCVTNSDSWAIGDSGIILKYSHETNKWNIYHVANEISNINLKKIKMNEDGSEGIAYGKYDGEILLFNKKKYSWEKIKINPIEEVREIGFSLPKFYLNQNGSSIWRIYKGNTYKLQKKNMEWELFAKIDNKTPNIKSLWVNTNDSSGWALTGSKEILKLNHENKKWYTYQSSLILRSNFYLGHTEISFDEKSNDGWISCLHEPTYKYNNASELWEKQNTKLKYLKKCHIKTNKQNLSSFIDQYGIIRIFNQELNSWDVLEKQNQIIYSDFTSLWMNKESNLGWAASSDGSMFKYNNRFQNWKIHQSSNELTNHQINSIWMNENADIGWAVGKKGTILHYDSKEDKWRLIAKKEPNIDTELRDVQLNQSGSNGIIIGENGTILVYKNNNWYSHSEQSLAKIDLFAVWVCDDDKCFIVGEHNTFIKFNYIKPHIEFHQPSKIINSNRLYKIGNKKKEKLRDIWINPHNNMGWVLGQGTIRNVNDTIINIQHSEIYTVFDQGKKLVFSNDGKKGFFLFTNGLVYFRDKHFFWDSTHMYSISDINVISMDNSFKKGWMFGNKGKIYKVFRDNIKPNADLYYPKNSFYDSIRIKFNSSYIDSINLQLLYSGKNMIEPKNYSFKKIDGNYNEFKIIFNNLHESFDKKLTPSKLVVQAFNKNSPRLRPITYITNDIEIDKINRKHNYPIMTIAIVILLNLIVLIASVFNSWIRKVLISPVGIVSIPIVPAKFIFTSFLIHNFRLLRLLLFKAYRENYFKSPGLDKWIINDNSYIPQAINKDYKIDIWEETFLKIIKEKGKLHLVVGDSGIGKTALLEKWTLLALKMNFTPILIRLGEYSDLSEAFKYQFKYYGGLYFKEDETMSILEDGGFVLLFDGFNECQKQEEFKTLLLNIIKKNHVIVSSQYSPALEKTVSQEDIHLEPFGEIQHEFLFEKCYNLDKEWVKIVSSNSMISNLMKLPHTADLTAKYISNHNDLPKFRLDIYKEIIKDISDNSYLLNLEEKAWNLFKNNIKNFESDNSTPIYFCRKANNLGILSKENEYFKFRHERLHRYFTACYLERQDIRKLIYWHNEIKTGLGRDHWFDCIEFWNEVKVDKLIRQKIIQGDYENFVLEVIEFCKDIYLQKIAPIIDLLEENNIYMSKKFWELAGKMLSKKSLYLVQ